ncbi:MAG: hypothetical protein EOP02_39945, partial [Proteobacteria bacterium]
EGVSRPRLAFLTGTAGQRLIGLACALLSAVLVLPVLGREPAPRPGDRLLLAGGDAARRPCGAAGLADDGGHRGCAVPRVDPDRQ